MNSDEIKAIANRLEAYQIWRRGSDDVTQPDPYQLGLDIDATIALLLMVADETPSDHILK